MVAGKEQLALAIEQDDLAGRVSGRLDYLELPLAQIDEITVSGSTVSERT